MGVKQPSTCAFSTSVSTPLQTIDRRRYLVTQPLTLASEFPVAGTASRVLVGIARAVMLARGCFSVRCSASK